MSQILDGGPRQYDDNNANNSTNYPSTVVLPSSRDTLSTCISALMMASSVLNTQTNQLVHCSVALTQGGTHLHSVYNMVHLNQLYHGIQSTTNLVASLALKISEFDQASEPPTRASAQCSTPSPVNLPSDALLSIHPQEELPLQPRKRKRDEAAAILAPRFIQSINCDIDKLDWDESHSTTPSSRTQFRDVADLRALLMAISHGNEERATDTIVQFLEMKSSSNIRHNIAQHLNSIDHQIVTGLMQSIAHHTDSKGGTRTTAAETFVKDVISASVWNIAMQDKPSIPPIATALGANYRQVNSAITRVQQLVTTNKPVLPYQRNEYKNKISEKAVPYIFDYLTDPDVTRLDTNQGLRECVDPRTGATIKVQKRIWMVTNVREQFANFHASVHYASFRRDNNNATVGRKIFRAIVQEWGKFVTYPKPKSCVDELKSAVEHAMVALLYILKFPHIKAIADQYQPDEDEVPYDELVTILKQAGYAKLVERMSCPRVECPDFWYDETKPCPTMIPLRCTHGMDHTGRNMCTACGTDKRLRLLTELLSRLDPDDLDHEVEVLVWDDALRQGNKKDGKPNTQRELTSKFMSIRDFLQYFIKSTHACVKHHSDCLWTNRMFRIQLSQMRKGEIIFNADFAASMNLSASETLNCATACHAVNEVFAVVSNRRLVKVVTKEVSKDDVEELIPVYTVHMHNFFRESFSKGKCNNHVMHNACAEALTKYYQEELPRYAGHELIRVGGRFDNCPNQYRCRHATLGVAQSNVDFTHNHSERWEFKGIHDQRGAIVKDLVQALELRTPPIRSPNAFAVFRNCIEHGRVTSEWRQYELANDPRLKAKKVWGVDECIFWFVAETEEQQQELQRLHPDLSHRIISCDPKNAHDTINGKSITGAAKLRQYRTVRRELPPLAFDNHPGEVPVYVSERICECKHCRTDRNSDQCKYKQYKNGRIVWMKPKLHCAEPNEAHADLDDEGIES